MASCLSNRVKALFARCCPLPEHIRDDDKGSVAGQFSLLSTAACSNMSNAAGLLHVAGLLQAGRVQMQTDRIPYQNGVLTR